MGQKHIITTKKQKHAEKNSGSFIIVGPMPFPVNSLKNFIKDSDVRLIFVDGGLIHAEKFKKLAPLLYKHSISVGDGDSTRRPITMKKTSQNISDLGFLLSKLLKKVSPERCLLVGFLGGRLDHQLFNLGEISHYLGQFSKPGAPLIQLDNKILFVGPGTHYSLIKGRFSLASFVTGKVKITGECDYQAKEWLSLPTLSSRGVSNTGYGEIKIETKKPLAIIRS